MELITERLILRPFQETDLDDLYEFLSQLENDEFEGYPGITRESSREHLKQRVGSEEFCAVVLKETGKVIGNIYCGKRDYDTKEVGYIINKDYQRCGYAAEALSAVIREAFRQGAHRIYAACDPRNESSWKLLEKAGLRREAHLQENLFFHRGDQGNPIWKDTYVYAVLSREYIQYPETETNSEERNHV